MEYNYLLFVPSLLSRDSSVCYKVDVEGISGDEYREYSGIQTNEALTQFVIDYLSNKGQLLNKIVMICTPEVRTEVKIEGKTTLEYYKDVIKGYIREKSNISETDLKAMFEEVPYEPQNNENENQIMSYLENIIKPNEECEGKKRIYVDFTGGSRSTALTLIFASRILDKSGIEIAKIFYSNLNDLGKKGYATIEECTRTYHIFSALEKGLMIKNDILERDDYATSEAEKLLNDMIKASRMNQTIEVMDNKKEIDQLIANIDDTSMSYTERKNIEEIKKRKEEILKGATNPITSMKNNLKKGNYDKALSDFREKIADVLLSEKIIKVTDKYVENGKIKGDIAINEIAASYGYYIGDTSRNTFIKSAKTYIQKLNENIKKSPEEVKEQYFGKKYFDLSEYLNHKINNGYKHNGFSKKMCDDIVVPHVEKYYNKERNFRKSIERYNELERLYMGFGYPFACTFGGRYFYKGYEDVYKVNFNNGVNSLQKFFEGKPDKKIEKILTYFPEENITYEMLVKALNTPENEALIVALFPYQLKTENISRGERAGKEWNTFMFEFAKSYNIIKEVRNKVFHPSELKKGEARRAIEELEMIIEKIELIREN